MKHKVKSAYEVPDSRVVNLRLPQGFLLSTLTVTSDSSGSDIYDDDDDTLNWN